MPRLVVDPVTRIGGHLRIEVEVAGGVVQDAWSSGTMFRGMELILRGRDPRDAWLFTQRVCGSCGGVHALAAVRAVENALGVRIPRNARLLRNIMAGAGLVQDHVVSFYHQHALDWVDVVAALSAEPAAAASFAQSISSWPRSSASYFEGVRARLATLVTSGQMGPFANGYWGHPAYTMAPAANLVVLAHYLEALDWRRRMTRIQTLLGGKNPHPQTYLVGGMAIAPPWGGPHHPLPGEHPRPLDQGSPAALSTRGLAELADLLREMRDFVDRVYQPDVLAIADHYRDWGSLGGGIGNYLAYGDFPEDDSVRPALLLPGGRIMGRALSGVEPVDQAAIAETVARSYYLDEEAGAPLRHPWDGLTDPKYAGPTLPLTSLEGSDKYSWLKAPRYDDEPMEVGPLARMLVAYVEGRGAARAGMSSAVAQLGIRPEALFSTLGRMVARAVEAHVVGARLERWLIDLRTNLATGDLAVAEITGWGPGAWPSRAQGWSFGEAPKGAVGHWVTIRDGHIEGYQIVDASTWNGSPRDARDRRGAWEEALLGTPVADPARPLEILRTVHSFDPCTACAVHSFDPGGNGPVEIAIR